MSERRDLKRVQRESVGAPPPPPTPLLHPLILGLDLDFDDEEVEGRDQVSFDRLRLCATVRDSARRVNGPAALSFDSTSLLRVS